MIETDISVVVYKIGTTGPTRFMNSKRSFAESFEEARKWADRVIGEQINPYDWRALISEYEHDGERQRCSRQAEFGYGEPMIYTAVSQAWSEWR